MKRYYPKIKKVTLLNRKSGPGFYAQIEREDGKIYHMVGKYKSYKDGLFKIKTFTSIPFIIQIDKKNIINKLVKKG